MKINFFEIFSIFSTNRFLLLLQNYAENPRIEYWSTMLNVEPDTQLDQGRQAQATSATLIRLNITEYCCKFVSPLLIYRYMMLQFRYMMLK